MKNKSLYLNIFTIALAIILSSFNTVKAPEDLSIGKHTFGVQFIWEGYGNATVSKQGGLTKIVGMQFSKDKKEYTKIDGTIKQTESNIIIFDGNIQIFTKGCCGVINKTGKFIFKKNGKRKYWRLQDFDKLCSQYTCAYYLDIFETCDKIKF